MKTQIKFFGILTAIIVSVCAIFISCEKEDVNNVVTYTGKVVYANTTTPFADCLVQVTDGNNIHCQGFTDASGAFSLQVRVNDINGDYYLLAGDATCVPKKVSLGGYGQAQVDLGTIEVEGPSLPVVTTKPISSVNADAAVCGGEVVSDGRLEVTARGVCCSPQPYPTIESLHTTDGNGLGEFTSNLKELQHNTIYYARAYATNKMGTAYGEQVKFTTEEGVPIVITDSVIRITAHSAKCKGHVESDGGYPVTVRGTCWSKHPDPTVDDDCTNDGSGLGEFTSTLSGLTINTQYYVRTYATNSTSTTYGEQIIFSTLDGLPIVETSLQNTSTATTITTGGKIVSDGDFAITERGVCYSTINAEPTISDVNEESIGNLSNAVFRLTLSDLLPNTTYYIRAYAINENGIAYGAPVSITTKSGAAIVKTGAITNITALTASGSVTITDAGGATLQSCGICWATTPNPSIEDSQTMASGKQLNTEYLCNMSGLQPNTTYYVRGYATTNITTSYSSQVTFKTLSGLPVLSTATTTATSTTISSGGNITSDGGYSITARGVCYSTTNSTPTIADGHTTAGNGTGVFSTTITNVSVSTTYYVRAYATNSIGTGYGEVVSIETMNGLPSVTTTDITLSGQTILSGGNVTDEGGAPVTARGVCYGKFPNPDLSSTYSHTSDGTGTGYYTSNLGSSLSGVIYVRAYATNANGTTYGSQKQVNVSYLKLPSFMYDGHKYRVAPSPNSYMSYGDAENYCNGLELFGYSDWRLPTYNELYQMYILRETIGGFINAEYWSYRNSTGAYTVNFSNGEKKYYDSSYFPTQRRVRPIRIEE